MYFKKQTSVNNKNNNLREFASLEQNQIFEKLNSSINGLNEEQVYMSQSKFGKNMIDENNFKWFKKLIWCILNPFILILIGMAAYYIFSFTYLKERDDIFSFIVVLFMVLLSVLVTFFQDFRSFKTGSKLRKMIQSNVLVYRNNGEINPNLTFELKDLDTVISRTKMVNVKNLVPGDIIFLAAGDVIPADVRVIVSKNFVINQSTLTGEAIEVEKYHSSLEKSRVKDQNLFDLNNTCFMGTTVMYGIALAVVINIGRRTYLGQVANALIKKRPKSSFQIGIKKITFTLITFMLVMVPIIFTINYFKEYSLIKPLTLAAATVVGLTPEMLPLIISVNLSKGANKMAQEKVIVKNVDSIYNFGAMDILCTDKTGTLTENKIKLVRYVDGKNILSNKVLEYGFLNSFLQTKTSSPIDEAISYHGIENQEDVLKNYRKIEELEFDFRRRRVSIIVENLNRENIIITKGAVEEMLNVSTKIEWGNEIIDLTPAIRKRILSLNTVFNKDGLRMVAVGYKVVNNKTDEWSIDDEDDLIFAGYLGFLDIPKKSVIKVIKSLKNYKVDIKILTGDNEVITRKICEMIGLNKISILLGNDIDDYTDEELRSAVEKTNIFAKLDPLQKARIVNALKINGHVVGYMGDGMNDISALHQADVGISVDSAIDAAKDASDIILLEKNLAVLEKGIIEGRKTFANVLKYVKITFASNFGNIFSTLIAAAWLPFQAMLGIQLLMQNILYDIAQLTVAWDRVDNEFIAKPQHWNSKSMVSFVLWNGPVSSIFDVITYALMAFYFGVMHNYNYEFASDVQPNKDLVSLFNSGWFVVGLLTQTLVVHMLRTSKVPIIKSRSTWPLAAASGIIAILGVSIPFMGIGGLRALPIEYFGFLVLILAGYILLAQLAKISYIKIFKTWL